eukprot:945160-Karenia_brevis.AAC.1
MGGTHGSLNRQPLVNADVMLDPSWKGTSYSPSVEWSDTINDFSGHDTSWAMDTRCALARILATAC